MSATTASDNEGELRLAASHFYGSSVTSNARAVSPSSLSTLAPLVWDETPTPSTPSARHDKSSSVVVVTVTAPTPILAVVPAESTILAVDRDGPRKHLGTKTIAINGIDDTTIDLGGCASTSHIVGVADILLSLKRFSIPNRQYVDGGIRSATLDGVCKAASWTLQRQVSDRTNSQQNNQLRNEPNIDMCVFIAPVCREECMANQAAVDPAAGGKKSMAKEAVNKPKKICCFEGGCPNKAIRGETCIKHSGKMKVVLCSVSGCPNKTVKNGVCVRHGAKKHKMCSHRGCTNIVKKSGVCIRHGAQVRKCSHEGCNNNALKVGVCVRHGAKRATCSNEGCANKVLKGGVCARHGATCAIEGCKNKVSTGDMCAKHCAITKTMIFRDENARLGKKKGVSIHDVADTLKQMTQPPPHTTIIMPC